MFGAEEIQAALRLVTGRGRGVVGRLQGKVRQTGEGKRGYVRIKEKRKGVYAREAGHGYRCLIAYVCAVADLMSQSRAQVRRRPRRPLPRLAHVHVAADAAAAAACTCHVAGDQAEAYTAVATVLWVEREPGSTAQERRYSEGVAGPETVVSVGKDEGLRIRHRYRDLLPREHACAPWPDPGQSVGGV
jgi:hypothetical protein